MHRRSLLQWTLNAVVTSRYLKSINTYAIIGDYKSSYKTFNNFNFTKNSNISTFRSERRRTDEHLFILDKK